VSTGPPVPSFWIPVPAIELVGTSQEIVSLSVLAVKKSAIQGDGFWGPDRLP